jgi:hypothetical protein
MSDSLTTDLIIFKKEMVMKMRMVFGMLVMALLWTSRVQGAYPANYVWNYGTMFSNTSAQGVADSQGNQVWRYCDSGSTTLPSEAPLMGCCHGWETPETWQVDWQGGHFDQIGQQWVYANDDGVQIQWVAPAEMNGRVAVEFAFNGNNDVYNNVNSTFTVFKNDTQISQVTQVGNYTYTGNVNVVPGDRISVRLVSNRWVAFANFSATVTNAPADPYPTGYVWNYSDLFSTVSAQGLADSHNNQVWRYCDSTSTTLPSAAPLMGYFFGWENPANWRINSESIGGKDQIGQQWVWANDDGVQIQWVAPAGMNGRVSVVFAFNGNNDVYNNVLSTFTVFKNDVEYSSITQVGNYTCTKIFDVVPEDRISVRLVSNRFVAFGDFSSTVTVINKEDYPANYEWNFGDMFSMTSSQGEVDSKGNQVWRYCDSGSSSLPSEATLMGYFFGWENPANWRIDSTVIGGRDQIGQQWVQANGDGIQVQWVAPVGVGGRKVKAVFAFNGNNDVYNNVWSTFTVFKNDIQVSEVAQIGNYTYTGLFDVEVNDRISVRLVSNRWVAFANFNATITVAPVVKQPVFTPNDSVISGPTPITISCPTSGAAIYYTNTTTGVEPTTSSTLYTGPVTVLNGSILKAIAVGTDTSWVTSQTYSYLQASAPVFSPGGKYISGPTPITISSSTANARFYYTTNGDDPTTSSTLYIKPVTVNGGTILKAIAVSDNTVASSVTSLTFTVPAAYSRPGTIPAGGVVAVDGDLSDWAGATWTPMDQPYESLAEDITAAYYSARWQSGKIYLAVKVLDKAPCFTDAYTAWDARDAIEIYIHTDNNGATTYPKATTAQQYIVGIKNTDHNAVWTAIGGAAVATPLNGSNFSGIGLAAGKVDGQWLYYEVALTPYTYLGFLETNDLSTSVVSHLDAGDVIGLDVNAIANNGSFFTGVKSENMLQEKYQNWERFGLHKLSAISGDANLDGAVDVGDLGILAANYGGSNKTWAQGDFNRDGLVDVGDLGILAANYGSSNFSSDYAKAFGTTVAEEDSSADVLSNSICSALGLPLIACFLLAGLMLGAYKMEE